MTKKDLVEILAKKGKCSKAQAANCLNIMLDEITKTLIKGKDVILTGFGTFRTIRRKARIGRNPQTGAKLKIPAKRVAKFKAGALLKKKVK